MNEAAIWLVGLPGAVLGFGAAVAFATTSRRALGVIGIGFLAAAVTWAVIDMLGGFADDGYDGLLYWGLIGLNLIGWVLGAGLGTEIRGLRERRRLARVATSAHDVETGSGDDDPRGPGSAGEA